MYYRRITRENKGKRFLEVVSVTFHSLAGLPRSGSTLLCNILNQHPDVYASSTSPLFECVNAVSITLTNSSEAKAMLNNVPDSYDHMFNSIRSLVSGWYEHREESIIIDKGRGWASRTDLFYELAHDGKMIVCVRDPRDVVASLLKQDQNSALFLSQSGITIQEKVTNMMSAEGIVGSTVRLIESLLSSKTSVAWVRYETFVVSPDVIMNNLSATLGLEPYEWDFNNVENTSTDLDALYNNKFPHEGSGAVQASQSNYEDFLTPEASDFITSSCPGLMQTFGYT